MKRSAAILALGAGLAMAASASAAAPVQLASFDNFTLDATYANWANPAVTTITSGPTAWTVRSQGYGSGYKYLGGEFNAAGNDTVQLDATVSEGVAGMLVDLVDANGNGLAYRFYGLTPGNGTNGTNNYTLQMKLSDGQYFAGTGVLDTTRISQMNIEIDPGPGGAIYTASWNNLSLVPEPSSIALIGLGCLAAARRRRA